MPGLVKPFLMHEIVDSCCLDCLQGEGAFSKRYLKYLAKKYLKKNQVSFNPGYLILEQGGMARRNCGDGMSSF